MFFVKWIAPAVLTACGIFMIKMGMRWFRSGNGVKGLMDVIAGSGFIVIGFALPLMV